MHSSFPNWYRSSRVKPDGERLKQAWKVVVGLQKKLGAPDMFEAVAWALDLVPTEDWPAEMTSQVVKIDPSFASEDRRHEVAVLAVCAVMAKMAGVLKSHVVKHGLYTEIKGKNYAHVEGWQFAGGLMGLYPMPV